METTKNAEEAPIPFKKDPRVWECKPISVTLTMEGRYFYLGTVCSSLALKFMIVINFQSQTRRVRPADLALWWQERNPEGG